MKSKYCHSCSIGLGEHARRVLLTACWALLLLLGLTGCPPTLPCDKKVEDALPYVEQLMTHPVMEQLSTEIVLGAASANNCFVDGWLDISFPVTMPADYSEFGIVYQDVLRLAVSEDGDLRLSSYSVVNMEQLNVLDAGVILEYFQGKIAEVEADARVGEVVRRTKPDPGNASTFLDWNTTIYRKDNWVEYNFYYHGVRDYLLQNSIRWEGFPEIALAHAAIEKNLLVGDLATCKIGRSGGHSYTTTSLHNQEQDPWILTVALLCGEKWKDASVQINPDGSYEKLTISMEY